MFLFATIRQIIDKYKQKIYNKQKILQINGKITEELKMLRFKVSNYKSFVEEIDLKMIAAPKIHDLEYSLIKNRVGRKIVKKLSSAVIYGPNAAGKTNLIGAIEVLKNIIIRGHIRNIEDNSGSPNFAKNKLELIPNINSSKDEPVKFLIEFIKNGSLIKYKLEIILGEFLNLKEERKIINEELYVNDKMIFSRGEKLEIANMKSISKMLVKGFDEKTSGILAKNNLNSEELFLTSLFKAIYSNELVSLILEWFEKDLIIIYRANQIKIGVDLNKNNELGKFYNKVNKAMKEFGLTGNSIRYLKEEEGKESESFSILERRNDEKIAVPCEVFESFGTVRFMNLFPIIYKALQNGQTLIIDEFDASIHPMALMSIINVFHNDEINKNGAQLVFNTHNPIFLDRNLYRRDEIKLLERDEETNNSNLYSLSDFGTSGPNGVRNTADYMKNYFINRYGAIKYVDFSEIFEDVVIDKKEGDFNDEKTE